MHRQACNSEAGLEKGSQRRDHKALTVDFETYAKPPIREAVLDIFATLPADVDLEALSVLGKVVQESFPSQKPRYRFSSNIRFNPEDSSKTSAAGNSTQIGWIWRTAKKERAVQARLDGFSFNRLPIYEGWGKFSSEARDHWNVYRQLASPQFVTSIGLRFINRILIPLPFASFRDYCLLFPDLPKGMPTSLSEFVMRFAAPSANAAGATSSVTVTFEPPPANNAVLPLILDVHVTQSFPAQTAKDDAPIWSAFELLRIEKNVLFEAGITDSARQLFRQ